MHAVKLQCTQAAKAYGQVAKCLNLHEGLNDCNLRPAVSSSDCAAYHFVPCLVVPGCPYSGVIKCHQATALLTISCHAWSCLDALIQVPLGDCATKRVKMECKVPIEFEYAIKVVQPNPAFKADHAMALKADHAMEAERYGRVFERAAPSLSA
eukprot:1160763-Pelagomonas_calceolata.AAC.3